MPETNKIKSKQPVIRVRYALIAIPLAAVFIVLGVLQPWATNSRTQSVLAKAITVMGTVKSYKVFGVPGIYMVNTNGTFDNENNYLLEEVRVP